MLGKPLNIRLNESTFLVLKELSATCRVPLSSVIRYVTDRFAESITDEKGFIERDLKDAIESNVDTASCKDVRHA